MGIFLVFFPEGQHNQQQHFNSSSPSLKTPTTTINSILKRTNSNHIFTKTQSTISVCALLIFLTLIVFTLSSFEPNNDFLKHHRRFLVQPEKPRPKNTPALQGLGTLYTRGTNAVNNLVICHVSEFVTTNELKLFLRAFHRSGLVSKSDLLFVFDSVSTIDSFDDVIREENDVFLKLVDRYGKVNKGVDLVNLVDFPVSFGLNFGEKVEKGEPIWGKRIKIGNSSLMNNNVSDDESELTRPSYGSVVGFGIGELDPENSLSGFMGFTDRVPIGLRRWASYPMILGRVRRKFKRVTLVDVKEVLLLGDPLRRVKGHTPDSVFLSSAQQKHGRKNKNSHRRVVNPSLIVGGERGVRRLSAAMLTEIVRATMRSRHKASSLTESVLVSQLASNEFLQKSIRFIMSTELIPDPSQVGGVELANMTVVRRGNSNLDIDEVVMKHICTFPIDSSVYAEC